MQPPQLVDVIRHQWRLIALTVILGLLAAALYGVLATRMYTATATVLVGVSVGATGSELQQANAFATQRTRTYMEIARSNRVLEAAAAYAQLGEGANVLEAVQVTTPLGTTAIDIAATQKSPDDAAALATAVAHALVEEVERAERVTAGSDAIVRLVVIHEPAPPEDPSSPMLVMTLFLGGLLGGAFGFVTAFIREFRNDRIRLASDLRQVYQGPVLARIPATSADRAPSDRDDGAVRRLAALLRIADSPAQTHTFALVAMQQGPAVARLALRLAHAYTQSATLAAVVDADLRDALLTRFMVDDGTEGRASILSGEPSVAPLASGESVLFIRATPTERAEEVLNSDDFLQLVSQLNEQYDVVLCATPSVNAHVDAVVVAHAAGRALLVVEQNVTTRSSVKHTRDQLALAGVHILGAVLITKR